MMPEPCRVLLVDDEAELRVVLGKRLARRGLLVSEAGDGMRALELAARETFDVVVLDMKMPGMDGLETLRRLKRDRPEVEVVILTGHADAEAAVSGMDLGAFDYLIKPVDLDRLVDAVEDAHREGLLRRGTTDAIPTGGKETG